MFYFSLKILYFVFKRLRSVLPWNDYTKKREREKERKREREKERKREREKERKREREKERKRESGTFSHCFSAFCHICHVLCLYIYVPFFPDSVIKTLRTTIKKSFPRRGGGGGGDEDNLKISNLFRLIGDMYAHIHI
jgi:hypothetical protein